jgi:hypothetical protein
MEVNMSEPEAWCMTRGELESEVLKLRAKVKEGIEDVCSDALLELAHEVWAVAQVMPSEGIEDAVSRIVTLLKSNRSKIEQEQVSNAADRNNRKKSKLDENARYYSTRVQA